MCVGEGGRVKASSPLCPCDLSLFPQLSDIPDSVHLAELLRGLMFGQRRGLGNVVRSSSQCTGFGQKQTSMACVYSNVITTGHWTHRFFNILNIAKASPGLCSGWPGRCHCMVTGTKSFQSNSTPLKLMHKDNIQIKYYFQKQNQNQNL